MKGDHEGISLKGFLKKKINLLRRATTREYINSPLHRGFIRFYLVIDEFNKFRRYKKDAITNSWRGIWRDCYSEVWTMLKKSFLRDFIQTEREN